MNPTLNSLLVFVGAGIGANARYWIGLWFVRRFDTAFPWATLVINIVGSLAIGIAVGYMLQQGDAPRWRLLVVVGLLGGFTTFSTFSNETMAMLNHGAYGRAIGYVAASVVLGVAGCCLGWLAGRAIGS